MSQKLLITIAEHLDQINIEYKLNILKLKCKRKLNYEIL